VAAAAPVAASAVAPIVVVPAPEVLLPATVLDTSSIAPASVVAATVVEGWESALESEAVALLGSGRTDVWDELTRRFETRLILAALSNTKGRRIEAAHKLGIGRNTITRKIQELGLE
jgi:two-component system nitrogen regulation response regulator GlnG